ncbi:pyridoxal 5'-phosphate synthase glutaminase subunit PdxT [Blastococcus sp. MG754426]|uniref:pyridoxal 5'-phosphate synthase glutaminase subunit PdxT n=1 Tax=unclassified Blastococcus TaxID=2619396 RepID=UPI001EF034C0|nr:MULTISPECIES: pyridoxal 5'-phosphate synthase glutaminase subunit PdxT [unclassified Blastococcus]MCF6507540.1 pyridoxal 5'-phosphate synthase glutaminase subunit PdxT [Blastococcus sp. MG754426]MCF6512076.1 pyridoxal 5'-phosphate synthase glutaminase subunit PdxT [Blastococcus sp. MG754427]MCF6735071.1 pyridoxal 5'-phosphate synthase glutaminase subunit PdxT [Blastococcus sp. KM273129]
MSTGPTRPVVGVLALQGDVREHVAALQAGGAEARQVRRPEELAAVDGIVLPGGESTTMAKLAARWGLLEPLRDAVRAGLPAYGSCAGMILLADRLLDAPPGQETVGGLDVTVRRNAFGRQVDSFETRVELDGLAGGPLHAVFIRAPWVEEAGPGVQVLGRVVGGPADGRIVAVRQGDVVATSFHPELTGDRRVHALFVDIVRRHLADAERGEP